MISNAAVKTPDVFTKNDREYIAPETPTSDCCHHYWLIDRANGPLSHAVCKYCREERNFSNLPVHTEEMKSDGSPAKQGLRSRSFSPYEFFGAKQRQPFSGRKEPVGISGR
jgi:hypothetical protein